MEITGLFIYPIKGCRAIAVTSASVDRLGFVGDRRFLIVDPTGKFITQRSHAVLAQIDAHLTNDDLIVTTPGQNALRVPLAPDPLAPLRKVQVWSSHDLLAEDCGPAVAQWFTAVLGEPVALVRIGPAFVRPVKPTKARPGDVVSFADGYPFLITGEAALADLNARLTERGEAPVPMNRFRPNLVFRGGAPFAEDTWPRFRVGDVVFRAAGACARCPVTTTDQQTGERGKEPLRTLATYRRDADTPTSVNFGQNLIHETPTGTVRLGDLITLL